MGQGKGNVVLTHGNPMDKQTEKIWFWYFVPILVTATLMFSLLAGCSPSTEDLEGVEYTPLPGDDRKISTPEVEELDPMLMAEMYYTMRLN